MAKTYNAIMLTNAEGGGEQYSNTLISYGSQQIDIVAVPIVDENSFTYDGTEQGITFTNLDTTHTILTNATATNAGDYVATVALKDENTIWEDGSITAKTYNWSIARVSSAITVSSASVALDKDHTSVEITVGNLNDRILAQPSSSDNTVATASASGNVVTISSVNNKSGDATITISAPQSTNYNASSATVSVTASFLVMKTFAAATDEEIAAMVAAADAGQIDLYEDCGWRVGQEHTTTLAAIASSGSYDGTSWSVGESQLQQEITLVLMHQGLYQLVTAVKDKNGNSRRTCSFVVGLKNCLTTQGYMNSTNTNSGSWNSSARRGWCNGGFRQAMPSDLRAVFKKFQCITGQYNGSTAGGDNITSLDYFALAAGKEVFGGGSSVSYSTNSEANALTQFTYYETASNRIKYHGNDSTPIAWWERSPDYSDSPYFCRVNNNGIAYHNTASGIVGLSPFGCL